MAERIKYGACKMYKEPFLFVILCHGKTESPVLLGSGDMGQGRPGAPVAWGIGTLRAKPVQTGRKPGQLPISREKQSVPSKDM